MDKIRRNYLFEHYRPVHFSFLRRLFALLISGFTKGDFLTGGLIVLLPAYLAAQNDYFQQEVHYDIEVTLDDISHTLEGSVAITYINRAPQALDSIYLHLWANAFSTRTTAFAEQQMRQGNPEFYFAGQADLGGYSGLDLQVDGQAVSWAFLPEMPDVALLRLAEPVKSGDSIVISTPFLLTIPSSFSRLGHVGQSYQMTQWYPKVAVYDRYGWHPMPYLDMGEFYSEFGSYDVRITLPDNYLVGATGVLQTPEELAFLEQKAAETSDYLARGVETSYEEAPFPPSSENFKTIRFTARQVHDFAWFADKRFRVQRGLAALPGGHKVDTWVFFTKYEEHLWQEALFFVERSLRFFSETAGPYPYPQVTAVQSTLSAGAGMEYPMITVIGPAGALPALDEVIAHEVAHNWFYAVLAFQERRHPWMDEGLTTYYEQRYMRRFYGGEREAGYLPDFFFGNSAMSTEELAYLYQARRNRDQAPDTPSEEFSTINYYLSAYQKTAAAFRYLEAYLGTETFDRLMQGFYREWQFRHPYPIDLRRYLEEHSGKNLDWLFDGLLFSNKKTDYSLTKLDKTGDSLMVTVKNKGRMAAPFALSGMEKGQIVRTVWYEGIAEKTTVAFPAGDYDEIALDAQRLAPELYRQNNRIRTSGLFPRLEPPLISVLPSVEKDSRTQLYLLPVPAWNNYDETMVGGLIYNALVPAKRLEFALAPLYSFGSKELVGVGDIGYHWYPHSGPFREITLGASLKSFHFRENETFDYRLRYTRIAPYLNLDLQHRPADPFAHRLQWRTLYISREEASFNDGEFTGLTNDRTFIHELSYSGENRRAVNPFSFHIALEQQQYEDINGDQHYLKAGLEWNYHFTYRPKKNIDFRFYAGGFLTNTRRNGGRLFPGALNLIARGFNDYRFDEYYFGRTEDEGFWSQQISLREGAFKAPLSSAFGLGRSNNFILALNLKADLPQNLPFLLPVKPYLDLGYFDNAQPTGQGDSFRDQLLWSGGLALDFLDGAIGIYFPLIHSSNLQDRLQERGNYWTRISFNIDFARLNPFSFLQEISY